MYVRGLVPPMVTPLTDDERLDVDAVGKVVEHLLEGGSHAIFVSGTMGEFFGLTDEVREGLVEVAAEKISGRAPLLAGVGESSTTRACERARHASKAGADMVVALAPYYFRYSQAEILDHLRRVRDASDVPVVIYENPHTTRLEIAIDTIMSLADEEGFAGLKDSSGDWTRFSKLAGLIAPRDDFFILQGNTLQAAQSVLAGADGYVPGIGNVDPELCRRLYDAAAAGDEDAARAAQDELNELRRLFGEGRALPAAKYAMEILGICGRTASSPLAPLDAPEKAHVRACLVRAGLI